MPDTFETDLGPFRTVVHPTAFDERDPAFVHALAIARRSAGHLIAVHVTEGDIAPDWELFPHARSRLALWGAVRADASPSALRDLGIGLADVRVARGRVAAVLARAVARERADLVVMSTHSRPGWLRLGDRSITRDTLDQAGIPALLHREGSGGFVDAITGRARLRRILVPVDHEPRPHAALGAACRMLDTFGVLEATVRMLHVGPVGTMPSLRPSPERDGVTLEPAYGEGMPGPAIAAHAAGWNADLIAMTTQGRHGLYDALLGSTVEQVVAEAPCPVLAVPA